MVPRSLKLGQPQELERTKTFLEVAKYLEENDDEQTTVIISKWKPF